jgi:hypothetical protein
MDFSGFESDTGQTPFNRCDPILVCRDAFSPLGVRGTDGPSLYPPAGAVQFCKLRKAIAMPRFYINFRRGGSTAKDDQGIECATLTEARTTALASVRELLAGDIKSGSKTPLEAVIIMSESGHELMTISAKEALPETLK